jgi:hypothetical protein
MADDPTKRGKADRGKVATLQPHEMAYFKKATGASEAQIKAAVKAVGNNRAKLTEHLRKKVGTILD